MEQQRAKTASCQVQADSAKRAATDAASTAREAKQQLQVRMQELAAAKSTIQQLRADMEGVRAQHRKDLDAQEVKLNAKAEVRDMLLHAPWCGLMLCDVVCVAATSVWSVMTDVVGYARGVYCSAVSACIHPSMHPPIIPSITGSSTRR